MEKKVFIYASEKMTSIASQFGEVLQIERTLFPNMMPNILIKGMEAIQNAPGGAHVVYFSQYESLAEKKLEEMIIFCLADTWNMESLVVVDMYDPLATMERVTEEGRVASSNCDAHYWKTLPCLQSGRKVLRVIFDHHTLQNRFFFTGGNTTVRTLSAVPMFVRFLREKHPHVDCIAFPDEGAFKRFSTLFAEAGYSFVVCGKKRDGDKRYVKIMEGIARDQHVVIVDDLVRSGGTLIQCLKAIQAKGAASVSMFVVHAEFPNESWRKFEDPDMGLDTFFVTNSVPRVTDELQNKKPFEVLNLAGELEFLF